MASWNYQMLVYENFLGIFRAEVVFENHSVETIWILLCCCATGAVIKFALDYASDEDRSCLLKEMSLMRDVGRHPSIVSMFACSMAPPFIVMDYCVNGDLKSYLRHIREQQQYSTTKLAFDYDCNNTGGL